MGLDPRVLKSFKRREEECSQAFPFFLGPGAAVCCLPIKSEYLDYSLFFGYPNKQAGSFDYDRGCRPLNKQRCLDCGLYQRKRDTLASPEELCWQGEAVGEADRKKKKHWW